MAIKVCDFRLSFIWVESHLDLPQPSSSSPAPLSFLGRSYEYEAAIEQLLCDREVRIEGLSLPWVNINHQGFWRHYFAGQVPPNAKRCLQGLVPLRGTFPSKPAPSWLSGRLHIESYYFPHGTALVVTAVSTAPLTLEEVVLMARKIRKTGKYTAAWLPASNKPVGLKTLADQALDVQRQTALGPGAQPGVRLTGPFTVFTVVQGEDVDYTTPFENGTVHRMLEAVTAWPNQWRSVPLPELEYVSLDTVWGSEANRFYGRKRGRAIWFPEQFSEQEDEIHSLACYHRNIVLASMTVESLAGLAKVTNQALSRRAHLSSDQRSWARHAARILGQLYGGASSIYSTMSTTVQIVENDYVAPINKLRRYFNMHELRA